MKRRILIVVCLLLVVSAGLVLNPLSPREANGQDRFETFFTTGLEIAGVYVEVSPPAGSSPRVVALYADGNWTVRAQETPRSFGMPSFGIWQPMEEGTTLDALVLDAVLSPSLDGLATTAPYTLAFDATLQSLMVTNTSTMEGFTAQRVSVTGTGTGTGTGTSTSTDTGTGTSTSTDTGTGTSTGTNTGTSTSTDTGTGTGTSTGTNTGTSTSTDTGTGTTTQ